MIDEKEAADLQNAAQELAELIAKTGRTARLFGVTPPVRKIMHTELNEDDRVKNSSEGYGMFRHLLLRPAELQKAAPAEEPEEAPAEEAVAEEPATEEPAEELAEELDEEVLEEIEEA